MLITYQLWVHCSTGCAYAVRLTCVHPDQPQQITGVYGPLDWLSSLAVEQFAHLPYQEGKAVDLILAHQDRYLVLVPNPPFDLSPVSVSSTIT